MGLFISPVGLTEQSQLVGRISADWVLGCRSSAVSLGRNVFCNLFCGLLFNLTQFLVQQLVSILFYCIVPLVVQLLISPFPLCNQEDIPYPRQQQQPNPLQVILRVSFLSNHLKVLYNSWLLSYNYFYIILPIFSVLLPSPQQSPLPAPLVISDHPAVSVSLISVT